MSAWLIFVVLIIMLDFLALKKVVTRTDISREQKQNQLMFALLIPIIGALFILVFHRSEDLKDEGKRNHGRLNTNNAIGDYDGGGD